MVGGTDLFPTIILNRMKELADVDFALARECIIFLLMLVGRQDVMAQFGKDQRFDADLRFRIALILEDCGSAKIALEIFDELANDDSAYEDIRVKAAECIAGRGYIHKVAQVLVKMAHSNELHRDFRVRAVECLQKHGYLDEASLCWVELATDPNVDPDPWHDKPWVRKHAIESLFHLKRVNELMELLQDKSLDGSLRSLAAQFLGVLGYIDQCVAALAEILSEPTEWFGTRREIAYWLGHFAQPAHLNIIQDLSIREKDDETRDILIQAIVRIRQRMAQSGQQET